MVGGVHGGEHAWRGVWGVCGGATRSGYRISPTEVPIPKERGRQPIIRSNFPKKKHEK